MNGWVRILGTTVACLMLLAVAARAAGSVSSERDRQTLDALLTSPLETHGMLAAKWLGNILSVRKGWLWLGAIYGLGLVTGGLSVLAVPLLIAAWLVYAAVVSAIGLWFSIWSRTTLRATVWTLFASAGAAVGHWLLWMCFAPILIALGPDPPFLQWVLKFQVGMTPPAVLGYSFSFYDAELYGRNSALRELGEFIGFAVLGLIVWGVIAGIIYASSSYRFSELTGRLGFVPARLPIRSGQPATDNSKEEAAKTGVAGEGR